MFLHILKGTSLGIAMLLAVFLVGWVLVTTLEFIVHFSNPGLGALLISSPVILFVAYLVGQGISGIQKQRRVR